MARLRRRCLPAAITVAVATVGVWWATAESASAAPLETACAGTLVGTTFTLTANCTTTASLTVPSGHTINGNGHTILATDIGGPQFDGAVLTNEAPGGSMNIENLTISSPSGGFQVCTLAGNVLYGILFNDASGSVSGVVVMHIVQQQTASPSCVTGTAIRAEGVTAPRTVTITNTVVEDYQRNGFDARGSMTMNVSGSTAGPPHPLEGLLAQNGLAYVNGASGTAANNTIFGSGDQQPPGPPGGGTDGTAVILFGATNVTVTHNTITGAKTDIGVAVVNDSTGIVISFNQIGRTAPDVPDPTGVGVLLDDSSTATLICNTFSGWRTDISGATQPPCSTTTTTAATTTTPVTAAAVTTAPIGVTAARAASPAGSTLPATGNDDGIVILGSALLLAGVALVARTRRRR
jgi:LPXTG-motif cell wall-anchored protein